MPAPAGTAPAAPSEAPAGLRDDGDLGARPAARPGESDEGNRRPAAPAVGGPPQQPRVRLVDELPDAGRRVRLPRPVLQVAAGRDDIHSRASPPPKPAAETSTRSSTPL